MTPFNFYFNANDILNFENRAIFGWFILIFTYNYSKRLKSERSDFGAYRKLNFFVFGYQTLKNVRNQNFFVRILHEALS